MCACVCVYMRTHARLSTCMFVCVCVCVHVSGLYGDRKPGRSAQMMVPDGGELSGARGGERERPPHGGSHPVTSSHAPSLFSPSCPLLSSPLLSTPPFSSPTSLHH